MFFKNPKFRRVIAAITLVFAGIYGGVGFVHVRTMSQLHAEGDRIAAAFQALNAERESAELLQQLVVAQRKAEFQRQEVDQLVRDVLEGTGYESWT